MPEVKPLKVVKVTCTECGGNARNHDVLREFKYEWIEEEEDEYCGETFSINYQICRCKGCDTVRFRQESWDTITLDDEGEPEIFSRIYPEVSSSDRSPIEMHEFPKQVGRIYSETIIAFNAGALTLAGGGLRAIVEAICLDREVSGRNLQKKIDDLVTKGLLAKPQAELLHEERYIGNAALHEMLPPAKQEIEDGLEVVEGLMNTIYVLPLRAQRLKKKREGQVK
jgi:hypothetical protein